MTTKNTLYGPYKSKQAALDATQNKNGAFGVTIKQRYRGLTIGILNDNNHIDEYWFKDGIEDSHLIKKNVEDITELKLDGNKIEKTTFLFSSDLENSESPLMSKINIQISENIQNDTNLQNRVSEAVENSIQNSDTITNAINLGIQGNSTITKFNNLLDGENIKLDALPTALRELPNNFENGVIKDSVLPTGLQKFTSKLSNDGKLSTLDVLPTGIITTANIKDNDIVKGLQSKFDSNGKLNVNNLTLPDTVITKDKLDNEGFAKQTTVSDLQDKFDTDGKLKVNNLTLPTDVVLESTLESNLPANIKAISENFEFNDGNLTIKDNSVLTTTFTKQTEVNGLISDKVSGLLTEGNQTFKDAVESAIGNGEVVNNAINSNVIIQGLQGKFSDGKLDTLVSNLTDTDGKFKLPDTVITKDKLDNEGFAKQNAVSDLQDKFDTDGKLKDELISTTFAKQNAVDTLQGNVSTLQTNVGGLQGNVKNLQSNFDSDGKLVNTALPTSVITKTNLDSNLPENIKNLSNNSSKLTNLAGKLDDNGKINSLDILPSTIALKTDLSGLQSTVSGLEGTMIGLQSTVASKADSSALSSLNSTVSGLQTTVNTKVTELNNNLAKKADSSALSSLQKSVGTLNSRTLSNKTGFVNIENNNISQSNLDLIYNSISDARISSDEVTMKLNPMETGYYYFILNNSNEIININDTLKANLDENEAYKFVFIDGTNKNVTEYYYTLNISEIFKKLNIIYNEKDGYTYSQIHLSENMFDVLLYKLQELGLNDYYKYLSELQENIKIIDDGSHIQCVSNTKFYDLSLKWPEISQVLKKYNKTEYYLTIKNKDGNLNGDFINDFCNKYKNYKNFDNSNIINKFINFINTEITCHDGPFYQYLKNKITNIKTNDLFKCYTLFTFNKNNQIECQDINILRLTIDYLINYGETIENIMTNYEHYFNVNSREDFYLFSINYSDYDADYNVGYGNYLSAFYNTLININSTSKNYYVTTKTFDDNLLNMKLSYVLNSMLYSVTSCWEGYINSVNTIKYENINNGSVSQYIVDGSNIIELPYKFKKDSDDELINWLNTYNIKCNSYLNSHDENDLIYFGSEYDIDVLINSYTYHIIPNAFQTNDEGYDLNYLTIDDVKSYINNLSEEEKVKKIFLALIEDNGYQYIFEQYVLNGEVLMTFQEYYTVQYSTSFISQLVNTGGVSVGGKQINFAKSDDVSNLTINSETNMEVVAQLVNGLIEDLTLIAQKVSLTDNEKANLSVIDLTGTTGKLTYDVTSGRYNSVKIEGNIPINPRPVTSL